MHESRHDYDCGLGAALRFYPDERTTWKIWYDTTWLLREFFGALRREYNWYIGIDEQEGFFGHGLLFARP